MKKLLFFLLNLKSTTLTIKTTSQKSKVIKRKSVITKSINSSSSSSSVESNDEESDVKSYSNSEIKTENISIKNNSTSVNKNIKKLKENTLTDTSVNSNKNTIESKDTNVLNETISSSENSSLKDKSKKSTIEDKKSEINSTSTAYSESKQICRVKRSPSIAVRRKRKEKKVLVLDLDETLIHSTSRGSRKHDYMIEVLLDKHICLYYVYKRPYVDSFLKKVSEWYKVVVFTASLKEYADPVIDYLDPEKKIFSKRYFRESCQFRNGIYMKDLQIIEKDLSKICLVDNSSFSYEINKENGIPIETWINDPKDRELLNLLPFLDSLRFVEDVRSILSLRL
ncbi:hypothetical protein BCR36DRAFT_276372 [Piromyces finnis]|uniref:FCP1 homology domain-containing protein n=1 Tax=Piromyces finnis TaxID=1754191 RepID=A0A1Y1VM09_9FUNG|nr:hypothetical protein BCR36DRAFT_276372 [Piromyces finnis]|eukprot:ORX58537.1 hypothetical protein BCR36DRAFT_276372 [Piromyces finnis]